MRQIEKTITKAWQRQAMWLWLLLPLSIVYGLISRLRRWLYYQGVLTSYRAPIPIMIIGNITVGGSGKTPLIIALVTYLQSCHIKVGVISRGHGGNASAMPCLVTADSLPQVAGDEPCLIASQTQAPISVCPNRQQAVVHLLASYPDLDLIISDDGLQHYALKRDIEWVVVDASRGFGNKQLLPTGYLREPIHRLHGTTVIHHYERTHDAITNQNHSNQAALTMTLIPDQMIPLMHRDKSQVILADSFSQYYPKVYGVSGIGYPTRFFNTLKSLGLSVVEKPFADHHEYVSADLIGLTQYPIVVTAKDAVKLRQLAAHDTTIANLPIWVLPVSAKLSDSCYECLNEQLEPFNIYGRPS